MKACNDLDFLNNYWKEAKNIGYKIKQELPKTIGSQAKSISKTGLLCFVKFSDITNSWSVDDLLAKVYGESKTLQILADKINYMILRGRANDVKPMIEKICTGRIKSLSKGLSKQEIISNKLKYSSDVRNRLLSTNYNREYLGKGHFRWNHQAHTLNNKEIKHLKTYFKIETYK